MCYVTVLQVCGVSAILTDPGLVCTGDTVLLTCTIPRGVQQVWSYNGDTIGDGQVTPGRLPPTNPDTVPEMGGVEFTLSLLEGSTSPDLVSQLSFTASTDMDGGTIQCAGSDGTSSVSDDSVIQVGQMCKSVVSELNGYLLLYSENFSRAKIFTIAFAIGYSFYEL